LRDKKKREKLVNFLSLIIEKKFTKIQSSSNPFGRLTGLLIGLIACLKEMLPSAKITGISFTI